MGMSIDESLVNLKKLQGDYQQFHDDVWQDPESYGIMAESLRIGIDIIRRYQMIQQIHKEWFSDKEHTSADAYTRIGEVIEDGND